MEITFKDGTKERLDKVDIGESSEGDTFYVFNDENGEIVAEVSLDSIKVIKWK
jgi:hypothetical protein